MIIFFNIIDYNYRTISSISVQGNLKIKYSFVTRGNFVCKQKIFNKYRVITIIAMTFKKFVTRNLIFAVNFSKTYSSL